MKIVAAPRSTFLDYPDDCSIATIVYFSGCAHGCPMCHNKDFQNADNTGFTINQYILQTMLVDAQLQLGVDIHKKPKLVFSGGDPLYASNITGVRDFLKEYGTGYDICIYTGYDIDYVKTSNLTNFKFIKCGKYDETKKCKAEKTNEYLQLASMNQDFYNERYEKVSINGKFLFKD